MNHQLFGAAAASRLRFLLCRKYSSSYCFNKENAESAHAVVRHGPRGHYVIMSKNGGYEGGDHLER